MRNKYLIAYDIADPKRLRQVHKKVSAFAIRGQKSFYECWLTTAELARFRTIVHRLLEDDDRLFIFPLKNTALPQLFGRAKLAELPFMII